MFFYYRISDKSYLKEKLPGISKEECLDNFLNIFSKIGKFKGIILADNCDNNTLKLIESKINDNISLHTSELGNAGSLLWCIEDSLDKDNEIIYFVEDDYLHSQESLNLIYDWQELNDNIHYATLYDHPDKYSKMYNYGETSKVYKNKHHWRLTQSTTMTFLTKKEYLKDDYLTWGKYLRNTSHPPDHQIFTELLNKNRKLVCAIPGSASHTDLTVSIAFRKNLIEDWVLEISYYSLIKKITDLKNKDLNLLVGNIIKDKKSYWEKIKLLNGILHF